MSDDDSARPLPVRTVRRATDGRITRLAEDFATTARITFR